MDIKALWVAGLKIRLCGCDTLGVEFVSGLLSHALLSHIFPALLCKQ